MHAHSQTTERTVQGWRGSIGTHPSPVFGVFAAGAAATLAGQLLLQAIGAYFGIDFNLGGPAQDGYLELSRNIAAGNGYVFDAGGLAVLHRPPLYPYVLAGLVAISGSALPVVVIVFQALLAGGLAAIAYANARVWFDARTGLVAAAFVAACPWLQYNVKNTAAGILVAFLYALFFTLVLRWARRPVQAPRAELLAGVGLGALGAALLLSHGVMQLAVPGLLAMGAIHAWLRRSPRHVLAFAVALGVAVAGVVPWTIRNYAVSGHFIPVASNNGVAYFLGEYHWEPTGVKERSLARNYEGTLRLAGLDPALSAHFRFSGILDADLERELNDRVLSHALANPGALVRKMGLNLAEFYFPIVWEIAYARDLRDSAPLLWIRGATSGYFALLWVAVVVGLIRRNRRDDVAFAAQGLGVAMHVGLFLPFLACGTYALPTLPLIAVLAARAVRRAPHGHRASIRRARKASNWTIVGALDPAPQSRTSQ